MTLNEARRRIVRALNEAGTTSPGLEADYILGFVLGVSRAFIMAYPDLAVSEEDNSRITEILRRRSAREPLQYIIGSWDFYGRTLETPAGVLIPRPETELLVERALELLPAAGGTFLDWGTGTGCIALSLLSENTRLRGIASDCNPLALAASWRNLKRYGVLDRCLLWHSRTPEDLPVAPSSLDMLVSNPPYIKTSLIGSLMREVLHEPLPALDGGADGMMWYLRLFAAAERLLRPGGSLLFESGDREQSEALVKFTPALLCLKGIIDDYSGTPRVLVWCRV